MKLILTISLIVLINQAKTNEPTCTTPDQQEGKCVSVYACSKIIDMILTKQPENIEFVRKSRCGSPTTYSVCCPNSKECEASATPNAKCCGRDDTVIYSEPTFIDEYTWLALIEYTKRGQSELLCGGTLISGKHVLTAAHCIAGDITDYGGKPTNVHLGEYDITHKNPDCEDLPDNFPYCNENLVVIRIKNIIVHPEYDPANSMRKHDIAILKLAKMAPYTHFIRPICLPSSDLSTAIKPYDGPQKKRNHIYTKVGGWGISGPHISSSKKRHAEVHILSKEDCQSVHNISLSGDQICAGGWGDHMTCNGDAGGPLMYQDDIDFTILGIASIGVSTCETNEPIVYTNVYHYLPWIEANTV